MACTILIADDHAVVADGIRHLLAAQGDLEVVGTAADGTEAVQLAEQLRPDITLLDIVMPQMNGIDAAREIVRRNPEARIIMLSMYSDSERVYQSLQAGARGYVLKRDLAEELIDAIRQVAANGRYLSPSVTDTVISDYLHEKKPPDALHQLSTRERHVLQLLVEGKSAASVARNLHLSPRTIETYKARLMRKLGLSDLPALVKFAVRHGLTPLE
jgi:DNA-binding NarL/FixJ family response regulator